MQSVERTYWMPYARAMIYRVLTDEEKFASVVKRIDRLDVLERTDIKGQVAARIDLPGGKIIETQGMVTGEENESLNFVTDNPFPMEIRWHLADQDNGTLVSYTIEIDLSPVVSFVPDLILKGYLSAEMDGDLKRLEQFVQTEADLV